MREYKINPAHRDKFLTQLTRRKGHTDPFNGTWAKETPRGFFTNATPQEIESTRLQVNLSFLEGPMLIIEVAS